MSDHPDIEKIDASVRDIVREVFSDPVNGTPDGISKAGCLALAKLGHEAWNAWRAAFPALVTHDGAYRKHVNNIAIFELLKNAVGEYPNYENISFSRFNFGERARFTSDKECYFPPNFEAACFGLNCEFQNIRFAPCTTFVGSQFEGGAHFRSCFFDMADFTACQVREDLTFNTATFNHLSRFWGIQVGRALCFNSVDFVGATSFKAQTYKEIENSCVNTQSLQVWSKTYGLEPNVFYELAFNSCTFSGDVDFSGRTFQYKLDFSTYHGKPPTQFMRTPPTFFGAKIHENTSFSGVVFPKPSGNQRASMAYRALMLAFSKQQAIREEQRFFRLEMAEEAKAAGIIRKPLYFLYAFFSDYGFNVWKPVLLLVLATLGAGTIYGSLAGLSPCLTGCSLNSEWFLFSISQALPLPGLDKLSDAASTNLFGKNFSSIALTATVILHKTTSLLALFLIGLGLRNLFKLK